MMRNVLAGLLLLTVIGGVEAAVSELEFKYEPLSALELGSLREEVNLDNASCSFSVGEILDARQNKETVGFAVSKSVNAKSVDKWLQSAAKSFIPNKSEQSGAKSIVANAKLVRLYSYPESMNILGVAALQVDYSRAGETLLTKYYRGFYAKMNWANGDSEYLSALNYSINDLMKKFVRDLDPVCQQISSGEYRSKKDKDVAVTPSKPVVEIKPVEETKESQVSEVNTPSPAVYIEKEKIMPEQSKQAIKETVVKNNNSDKETIVETRDRVSKPNRTELSYAVPEKRNVSQRYPRPVQERARAPKRESKEKVIDAVACGDEYSYMFAICQ